MRTSGHAFVGPSRLGLCLVASFFSLAQARAQSLDPTRLISQYGHSVWWTKDGLIGAASPITQTTDGYIWMVALGRDHLLRFDGTRFVPVRPPKDHPLPGRITSLLGARDGSLWIGTRAGLSRLKDAHFSTLTKPSDAFGIIAMIEDHAGKIWVTRYRVPKGEGGLCEAADSGLRCYGPSDGLSARSGFGLAEDVNGYLWFVEADALYRWRPGSQATQYFTSFEHPQLLDVAQDHSGNVWATMNDVGPRFGVQYLQNGAWTAYSTGQFRSSTLKGGSLLVDRAGSVWIGTDNDGLYRISNGVVDHFSKADGLSGYAVDTGGLYEDREGNLWVSTDGGLDLFRNSSVTTYSMGEGLRSPYLATVLATRDGTVWAGEQENLIETSAARLADILRPGPAHRFSEGPVLPGRIGAMYQDHAGALWFALDMDLVVYDHGTVARVTQDGQAIPSSKVPGEGIRTIFEDSSGDILALTATKLLRIKDRRVQEAVELPMRVSESGYLAANPIGGVWIVGRKEGVALYQNGVMRNYSIPVDTKPIVIEGVVADRDDPLMLATRAGLFRWSGQHWDALTEANGLPCNLLGLIKDRAGSLWLPANCGLLKMEASSLHDWRHDPGRRPSFTVLDAMDGARPPGRGYSEEPTMSLGPDGKVWYVTGGTIQMVDPDHIYKNLLPPPVHVEELIADNRSFQSDGSLRLPPNPHSLEIDYTALSFSLPQKVLFRYFLEGHDKHWQEPVSRRQAFYTDLPPGNYRFHVIACNNSGVWNEVGAVAAFNIEPTFYQTLAFKAVVAVALVGALWSLFLLRVKQAKAHVRERLWAQMEERERIARELHDTLLQGFQGITLRVQGVAKNISAQDPLRKTMDDVLDRADDVLREARQRVRNLRRRATDEIELAERLTKRGDELSQDQGSSFTLEIVGTPKVLEPTVQEEAYTISSEALTNAFRHASASKIEVEIAYDSSALRIRVRDDGVGIDKSVVSGGQPGHWGLTGMRERARSIRSELKIWSREAAGTEVELVVPASIAYPRQEIETV